MNRLHQSLVFLIILLSVLKLTYASFAFCINDNFSGLIKEVVGFRLWNETGQDGQQYRTIIFARKTKLESNGWVLNLQWSIDPGPSFINEVKVAHMNQPNLGDNADGAIEFRRICSNVKNREDFYYGCYEVGPCGFCESHKKVFQLACVAGLDMGTDSISCETQSDTAHILGPHKDSDLHHSP